MKIIIKQYALLKKKQKKQKKNWSNITIGSINNLNEIRKKKNTLFFTKKTRLLNKKNGLTVYVQEIPKNQKINEIIFNNKKYTNKWINRIVNVKKIEFKQLFLPKNIILGTALLRNKLLLILLNKNKKKEE